MEASVSHQSATGRNNQPLPTDRHSEEERGAPTTQASIEDRVTQLAVREMFNKTERPPGDIAKFTAEVRRQVQGVKDGLRESFFIRRAKIILPAISATQREVLELASKTNVTPEQIVNNFEKAARIMETAARTISQLGQIDKPTSKMMKFQDDLCELIVSLSRAMEVFEKADAVDITMAKAEEKKENAAIVAAAETFGQKERVAFGLAYFEKTADNAVDTIKAVLDALDSGVDISEEILRSALSITNAAMKLMKNAQEAERPVVKVTEKKQLRSLFGMKITGKSSRLRNFVSMAMDRTEVQELISKAKITQREQAATVGRGDIDAGESPPNSAQLIEKIEQKYNFIEQGPVAKTTISDLKNPFERELMNALKYSLEHEEDGVSDLTKSQMQTLINEGFRLKGELSGKHNINEWTYDQIFDVAYLYIKLLIIYSEYNLSLYEDSKKGGSELYQKRLSHLKKGMIEAYEKCYPAIFNEIFPKEETRMKFELFYIVDGKEENGKMTTRVEEVWKKAWEIYFNIYVIIKKPSPTNKKDVFAFFAVNKRIFDADNDGDRE
ncbi:MAG: hypothetical protein K940chlam7_00896 [Chlamydiae bacterium]|nr:hypothetical protein [Chlamydiota bacterium]